MYSNSLNAFIYRASLRPADAIVVNKALWGILDHYVIYLGRHYGEHTFIANMQGGVKCLSQQEILEMLPSFEINRIRYFQGNHFQREAAIQRGINLIGQDYNLLHFNCEHYANYVQTGEASSQQSKIAGNLAVAAGAFLLIRELFKQDEEENYA